MKHLIIDIEWEKIVIILITFIFGMVIGHVQEARWSEITEAALVKQIERQDCSDVNPYKTP